MAYAESDLHDEEAMLEQELASFAEVVDIEEMMKLCDEAIAGREEAQLALVEKKKNLVKAKVSGFVTLSQSSWRWCFASSIYLLLVAL